jgi:hypothetical protein
MTNRRRGGKSGMLMRRSVCDCLTTDDVAGFVCSHIEGVHTLTLRLIKEKIRRNLRPYPSTLGWMVRRSVGTGPAAFQASQGKLQRS